MTPLDRLAELCDRHDLPYTDEASERFETYLEILLHFNDSMNLIGPMEADEVVDTLLIDSILPAVLRRPEGSIIDVGTGAGLPGIPLSVLYPDRDVVLVEPRKKRTTFLKIARQRLGLDHLQLERCRVEELDDDQIGVHDIAISKAFQSPDEWLRTAEPLVDDAGSIICMTRPGERPTLERTADDLGLTIQSSCEDITELGAPEQETPRAIFVLGH
jgi:16S rRNA (guanine527-N7)-methyltransferase